MDVANGCMPMVDVRPTVSVCIDACPRAAGGFSDGEYVYTPWTSWPGTSEQHINFQETLALEPAVARVGHKWRGHTVFVHCDNQATVGIINKGSSRNTVVMDSLRRIFWWSTMFDFRLRAVYIPGPHNEIADTISRLHEPKSINKLKILVDAIYSQFTSYYRCPAQFGPDGPRPGGEELSQLHLRTKYPEDLQDPT